MNQPDWLVEDYDGQMPCLTDNGEAYTESSEIAEYIEYFYPEPTLSLKDNPDAMEKVCVSARYLCRLRSHSKLVLAHDRLLAEIMRWRSHDKVGRGVEGKGGRNICRLVGPFIQEQ